MDTDPHVAAVPTPLEATFVCRWAASLLLVPPCTDALATYATAEGSMLLAALRGDPALAQTGEALSALTEAPDGLEIAASRLAAEHSRAFLVGGPQAVPPYASVWRSEKGLLWQEPARQMARLLRETGLVIDTGTPEPPDHLAIQLNLLAALLEREAEGGETPLPAAEFAHEHVMSWVPDLATALRRRGYTVFYGGLIEGLIGFLRHNLANQTEHQPGLAGREPALTGKPATTNATI